MPEKPKTQKETNDQIWYAIYGTNPHEGLLARMARIEDRLFNGNGMSLWKILKTRGIEALLIGVVVAVVMLFAFGKGDIGQVIELIRAVRGVG